MSSTDAMRDLSLQMKVSEVGLLHDALQKLGYGDEISKEEKEEKYVGPTTRGAVLKFQAANKLEETGIVDQATLSKIHELVLAASPLQVTGTIVTDLGAPAKGITVIAVDKGFKNDIELGTAITDEFGHYAIEYKREALEERGKQNGDIEIRVVDPADSTKTLGTSSIHIEAGQNEVINLAIEGRRLTEPTEFSQIVADLMAQVKTGGLKDLQENKERQEVSYLASKTGWDARLVAFAALADQRSSESGVPPALYYALFRAGISVDADELYRTAIKAVQGVWEGAIAGNVIDASLKPILKQSLDALKDHGVTRLLDDAKSFGVSSFKELLNVVLTDSAQQSQFTRLYYYDAPDVDTMWKQAGQNLGSTQADQLQRVGKLSYLTLNNAPLIKKLAGTGGVPAPSDLIERGLYEADAWDAVLGVDIAVPSELLGEAIERRQAYQSYMAALLKISYPTAIVAHMIQTGVLQLQESDEVKKRVSEFLWSEQDTFRLGIHPIEQFLKEHNLTLDPLAMAVIKNLHRVYQLSPSDTAMKGLWDMGLISTENRRIH